MTFLLCDVVFAGCKHVSGPREYDGILFYKLYLFVVCIENIVLQLCKTRYDGELEFSLNGSFYNVTTLQIKFVLNLLDSVH